MIIDQYPIRKSNGTEGTHYELHLDGTMEPQLCTTPGDQGKSVVEGCIREILGTGGLLLVRDHRCFERIGTLQQVIADITLYPVADLGFVFLADLTTPRGSILAELSGLFLAYGSDRGTQGTEKIRRSIAEVFDIDFHFGPRMAPFGI